MARIVATARKKKDEETNSRKSLLWIEANCSQIKAASDRTTQTAPKRAHGFISTALFTQTSLFVRFSHI
jgi:hypothetical protein